MRLIYLVKKIIWLKKYEYERIEKENHFIEHKVKILILELY